MFAYPIVHELLAKSSSERALVGQIINDIVGKYIICIIFTILRIDWRIKTFLIQKTMYPQYFIFLLFIDSLHSLWKKLKFLTNTQTDEQIFQVTVSYCSFLLSMHRSHSEQWVQAY